MFYLAGESMHVFPEKNLFIFPSGSLDIVYVSTIIPNGENWNFN